MFPLNYLLLLVVPDLKTVMHSRCFAIHLGLHRALRFCGDLNLGQYRSLFEIRFALNVQIQEMYHHISDNPAFVILYLFIEMSFWY